MRPRTSSSKVGQDRYLVDAVLRACDVLEAFQSDGELLRISEISERTRLARPTVLRILYTLQRRGLVARVGQHQYRIEIRPLKRSRYRVGYGSHTSEFGFSRDVADSIARAAKKEGITLQILDNRYSASVAIRNAEVFIRERMDLVVEFQADEHVAAPIISSKLMDANIPLIAVEIPHPGATYYGANNYAAGLIGGRYLGKWAKQQWRAPVDEVLLLQLPLSGPLPASRLVGILEGIREVLPQISEANVVRLDGKGQFGPSLEAVRKHLRKSRSRRILVGAINDPSAIGALRAFEESGRAGDCAIMGQNASAEGRCELRRSGTRMIGSVGYFPETYGEGIIALAIDILRRQPVPPAVFVEHHLVTAANVDRFYPNDALIVVGDLDPMLLSKGRRN